MKTRKKAVTTLKTGSCQRCQRKFEKADARARNKKFCSEECRTKHWREKHFNSVCPNCGQEL